MPEIHDVIIIGGGIIGLCCAIALQSRGYTPIIIDKHVIATTEDHTFPRVFALNHGSELLLQKLQLWDSLSHVTSYEAMHIRDAASKAEIQLNARLKGWNKLGVMVEETHFKNSLIVEAQKRNITFLSHQNIHTITEKNNAMIVKSQQHTWQTPLLIITDGAQSQARTLLNVKTTSWSYHQHALVAKIKVTLPHKNIAHQIFLPKGPLAFLPTSDPHICSIVWSTTPKQAEQLFHLAPEDFNKQLAHAFELRLGSCFLIGQRFHFPLTMQHVNQYADRHWLIMGDAAHTIHPLAGLGLNLGLADLNAWLNLLEGAPKLSLSLMKAWERERKAQVWKLIALMDALKFTFGHPVPLIQKLRGLGMQWINQSGLSKELMMTYANL